MHVLVTGGSGFIGSHLIERLTELGHSVVVFDSRKPAHKDVAFVSGDIRDRDSVFRAISGVDVVFHLAAIADARSTNDDLLYETNFIGSKNVFEAASSVGAKVVFASTCAVYGNGDIPAREESPCKPASQYGKSKLRAEKIVPEGSFIARLFNVYGPNSRSVVTEFCKKAPEYEDVIVFGTGNRTRDYIYIDDVIDALILGVEHDGIYNVGTDKEHTAMNILDIIKNITGVQAHIKHTSDPPNDIIRSRADTTKLMGLGWKPRVELRDGIRRVLDSVGWKPVT